MADRSRGIEEVGKDHPHRALLRRGGMGYPGIVAPNLGRGEGSGSSAGRRTASMNRKGLTLLLLAAVAWVVVAVLLGTGSLSGAHTFVAPGGPSPACLPATLGHGAELPGTTVEVSPAPETDTANQDTQVSFLGAPVTDIQQVSVEGSRTGYHYGHLYGYFQGDGGSFVPYKPFANGEQVEVRATVGAQGSARPTSFS